MNKFMDKFKKKKLLAFTLILVLILLIQSVSSLFTSSNLEDEVLLIYISFSLLLSITYSLSDESTLKEFFIIISGVIMFLIGCWLAFSFESLFNDWSFWVLIIVSPFMIITGYVNLKRKKVGNPKNRL